MEGVRNFNSPLFNKILNISVVRDAETSNYSNDRKGSSAMCIYCNTIYYKKIYKAHYGAIPVEANGRTYEIHHIDGNHDNNDPANLVAITLQEHYDIHYAQGDYGACHLMSVQRMDKTPEEISKLGQLLQQKRIIDKTHNFLGSTNPVYTKIKNKTHHFFGGQIQKESTNKSIAEGRHNSQIKVSCVCCQQVCSLPMFSRWHKTTCKSI